MAAYEVEGPDGTIYEVEAADDNAARAKVRTHLSGQRPDKRAQYGGKPDQARDTLRSGLQGAQNAVESISDPLAVPGAMLERLIPQAKAVTRSPLARSVANSFFPGVPLSPREQQQQYEPQTQGGRYAKTAGEFAPAALFPGSALQRGARVLAPAIGSETAGQWAEGTPLEIPARVLGGIAGGVGGEVSGTLATKALAGVPRPIPAPGQLNSLGAGVGWQQAPKTQAQAVNRSTAALVERSGGVPAMQQRAQQYRDAGLTPRTFQAAGEPGLQRMQTLTTTPGKTPQAAADIIDAEVGAHPARAAGAVDAAFGTKPRTLLQVEIDNTFNELSPQYDDLLRGVDLAPLAPRIHAVERTIPARYLDDVKTTMAEIAQLEGKSLAQMGAAEALHLMKRGLGQVIESMEGKPGLKADVLRGLTIAKQRLNALLEQAVPGYRSLNSRWGAYEKAQIALGRGGDAAGFATDFFNAGATAHTDDELRSLFASMPPPAQEAALASIRNRARLMISTKRTAGEGNVNIAGQFLSPETLNRFEAVLGPKAKPLVAQLKILDRDFRDYAHIAPRKYAASTIQSDLADMAMSMPRPSGLAEKVLEWGYAHGIANPIAEGMRNKQGAQLLAPLTPEMERAIAAEVARRAARNAAVKRGGLLSAAAEARDQQP